MGKPMKVAAAVVLGVVVTYGLVAMTPLTAYIGRSDPALASLFRPLFFNFSNTYKTGRVLEFHIGMSRDSFFTTLESAYAGKGVIWVDCRIVTRRSIVPMTPGVEVKAIYGGGDRFCGRLGPEGPIVTVHFQGDAVSRMRVSYVRMEGT